MRPVGDFGDIGELMDELCVVRWDATAVDDEGVRDRSRHLLIDWNGGILWLNLLDMASAVEADQVPHFCVDVRWIRDAQVVDQGLFVWRNGQRYTLASGPGGVGPPQGSHGWPGGETVSLLVDGPPLEEAELERGGDAAGS